MVYPFIFSESIFGYKDLKIKIYYTAGKLVTYLGIEYKEKADPKKFDGVEVSSFLIFFVF